MLIKNFSTSKITFHLKNMYIYSFYTILYYGTHNGGFCTPAPQKIWAFRSLDPYWVGWFHTGLANYEMNKNMHNRHLKPLVENSKQV